MDNEYRPEERNEFEKLICEEPRGEEPLLECEKHHVHDSACISIVHQNVCVEAIVTIKPRIKVGEGATVHCKHFEIKKHEHHHKPPHHHVHRHKLHTPEIVAYSKPTTSYAEDECSFVVSQELCLMIPLSFSAEAIVKSEKIHCENQDDCE